MTKSDLYMLFDKYKNIFKEELGTVSSHKATLQIRPGASPKFHKACPVPIAIKEAVGAQLDHLESEGILVKVKHSDWAAPIVAVPKQDGKFRDYKVTVNAALDIDHYPLPKPDDLFTSLAGGQKFTKSLKLTNNWSWMKAHASLPQSLLTKACISTPGCQLELHPPQPFFRKQWTKSFREFST